MNWFHQFIVSAAAFLALSSAFAQNTTPDTLIKTISDEVLTIVRQDKAIQSGDAKKAAVLVEVKMLPHVNFTRMTALAVGKDWRAANPAQRQSLIDEFRTLLVRTYAKALTEYRDQTIHFKPMKTQPADTEVIVRTEVRQSGSKPIQIDYELEKQDSGEWKVFDISVAGISLVTNYRNSFSQEISAGGIDGLIGTLRTKNTQVAKK